MKRWQNILIQIAGIATSVGTVVAGSPVFGLTPKTQAWVILGSTLAQALAANIAHDSNPDGTPATVPYRPEGPASIKAGDK